MASMKSVSPSRKNESPKTPGGISKSLLTPCRRVGLSRKWKKGGSPFISPLNTQNSTPEKVEDRETRKRKKCDEIAILDSSETPKNRIFIDDSDIDTPVSCNTTANDITTTPIRNPQIARKKSKTLSLSVQNSPDCKKKVSKSLESRSKDATKEKSSREISKEIEISKIAVENMPKQEKEDTEIVSKPVRSDSKSKINLSLKRNNSKSDCKGLNCEKSPNNETKNKSPNNLTKECVVVIQKKIFKVDAKESNEPIVVKTSQDSDSEMPLSVLAKKSENVTLDILNDDDFISEPVKTQPKKKLINLSLKRLTKQNHNDENLSQASQSSEEGSDKRTILIKKSYEKVAQPLKAKSTGSITQKDIDELKERIEVKKKLLMAKAMSIDTEELRSLIKKWQKGCQDALIELLDLMKRKMPDQKNMDYAEILQALKIPTELVGYDSENDCFITPDDTNVLLSSFKL